MESDLLRSLICIIIKVGLVVAVFGALFNVVVLWLPLDYKATGFMLGFWVGSCILGTVNSRIEDHSFNCIRIK